MCVSVCVCMYCYQSRNQLAKESVCGGRRLLDEKRNGQPKRQTKIDCLLDRLLLPTIVVITSIGFEMVCIFIGGLIKARARCARQFWHLNCARYLICQ